MIGILGGTGKEGQGLALRWAKGGVDVLLGSRTPDKAERVAKELNRILGRVAVRGLSNREVAAQAPAVVSTLPHSGHRETLESVKKELNGKLLMVATVIWPPGPLDRPSAAEEAQDVLKEEATVVAAFQTVSAVALRHLDEEMTDHVLVCGDKAEARRQAVELIGRTGLRGVEAGNLRNARIVEATTAILLKVNKTYGIKHAGLRITGLD
jgi:NADPH-dependent F420 reductase